MSLYHNLTSSATPGKINLYRVTRAWPEGGGVNACQKTGAIWQEAQPDLPWTATTKGGDYDGAIVTSKTDNTVPAGWDDYVGMASLVGQWVAGTAPNHGVLLRLDSEAIPTSGARWFDYRSDDETGDPTHRPKLTVDYNDASAVVAPTVALAAPSPGDRVSGSGVRVVAAASDDRRVDRVEFYVDGALKATDTAAPFETTWDSTSVATGTTHSITAKATDDAGNQTTTSAATSVTVDNTNAPLTAVTAATPGTADASKWTVTATAADDVGVARVEFYADQAKFAEDTTEPYTATWDTLDPLASAYDGAHTLTTKAYDTSGQVTTSAGRAVTVANSTGSEYQASFELNAPGTADDVVPPLMTANPTAAAQEPYASPTLTRWLWSAPWDFTTLGGATATAAETTTATGCPTGAYCPTVTVTNTSTVAWKNNTGTDLRVWYRWYAPNGVVLYEGPASDNFPQTVQPGASKTLPLVINPPALPPGAQLGQYRLRLDLYDQVTGRWFAQGGNPPSIDNPILVARSLKDALGLERYWQYQGEPVGAGMSTLTNVANGNMLLRWTPFADPGRGLSTVVDLTYNGLEDHSDSPVGNNFSLAISGLTRFGMGLDIHPNKADDISGNADKWVAFVDGDGTPHRFVGTTQPDGSTRWAEPAGVNLYLRSVAANPPERRWALTRPDKVTFYFYFDVDGYPTAVTDRNNNTLSFTLDPVDPADDPGGPKKHVTAVTDSALRAFTVVYYTKADTQKPQVRGKIRRITDHGGHALDFDYYEDGNLLRITQRGGTNADGTFLADRSVVFTYTDNTGTAGASADLATPDPKTPSQSTRLYSVRDPRGATTRFTYFGPSAGPALRWRLKDRTNRLVKQTSFAYDPVARTTTVTAPPAASPRVTTYTYDTDGKVTQITNPLHQSTGVTWTTDFKVSKVTEPTGVFTSYEYNDNGYLTKIIEPTVTDGQRDTTVLGYRNDPVDTADTAGHLSLLVSRTNPKGVATPTVPDDFQWTFGYDLAGNLATITDPGPDPGHHATTTNAWNPDGTLASTTDANHHATTYNTYDPSGLPTRITDAKGQVTQAGYDADGLLVWLQDPLHAGDSGSDTRSYRRQFDYDSFRRLGRQSAPKSTRFDRGQLIWTSAAYDPGDNLVKQVGARYGASDPGVGPTSTVTYDDMDQSTLASNPQDEQTKVEYDDAGRAIQVTSPKGVATSGPLDLDKDFATLYDYDDLDRVIRQKQVAVDPATGAITATRITHSCYDLAGDLRSVTQPNANLGSVTCPGTGPATGVGFTSTYDYDEAHRPLAATDPLGHKQSRRYDANGNVDQTTDANNQTTTLDYDQRDLPVQITEPFDAGSGRKVTSRFAYDAVGNRAKLISPRAFDAGGPSGPWTQYVTDYAYDQIDQLIRTDLPKTSSEIERQSIHRAYDANGNLEWTSLPVATQNAADIAGSSTARTLMSYFDPGWVRTAKDPANPRVTFDYTPQGWQASRTPDVKAAPGTPDRGRTSRWEYFPDGQLKTLVGRDGKPNSYTWDANNNLSTATQRRGVDDPGQTRTKVQATYTGFDQLAKVRHKQASQANWTVTQYKTYDRDGNLTDRLDGGQENDAGTVQPTPIARRNTFAYDQADWLTTQFDWGTDATSCSGDQKITNTFTPVGQEATRTLAKGTSSCTESSPAWSPKQTTTWDWFANAKLKTLVTKNGNNTVLESHTVGYTDRASTTDPTILYINGNRTSDTYTLQGPGATACASTPCTQTWTYDARDRLIRHD